MKFRTSKIAPLALSVALAFGVAACETDDTVNDEVQDVEEGVEDTGEEVEEGAEDATDEAESEMDEETSDEG